MKISAIIITKNEAQNIGRCLTSLTPVADEIIIVDAYSQDTTHQICESFENVHFVSCPWIGLTAMRNLGKKIAKYDHVLNISADEVLSPELQHNLLMAKKSLNSEVLIMMNYVGGNSVVVEPHFSEPTIPTKIVHVRKKEFITYYPTRKRDRLQKQSLFSEI